MTRNMFLAACAAGAVLSTGAQAQDWRDRETRSITVESAALDLSTDAGVDELSHRIGRAVNRICGSDRDCRAEAWASTEEQVAWAIDRDEWTRRLAEERRAQLAACGWQGCAPEPRPAYYVPQPCPPGMPGVTVTIVYAAPAAYRHY